MYQSERECVLGKMYDKCGSIWMPKIMYVITNVHIHFFLCCWVGKKYFESRWMQKKNREKENNRGRNENRVQSDETKQKKPSSCR